MNEHIRETLNRGYLGLIGSFGGVGISFMPQLETGLRVLSLAIGITVGILTIVSLIKNLRKK